MKINYFGEKTSYEKLNEMIGLSSIKADIKEFISLAQLKAQSYIVDEDDYSALVHHNFDRTNDFSNGRWIRNLNERIIRKLALRLYEDENGDITKITKEDLTAVKL